jgi:hypothetical protein
VESRRWDLVHAHDARSHTLAAVGVSRPIVVARRVAFPIGSKWKYGRAARYIAVSRFVAGVLEQGGVEKDRISVVYDGVPLLHPAKEKCGVLAGANSADPLKGASVAAEAARIAGVPIVFSDDLERDLPGTAVFVSLSRSEGLGSAALLAMSAGAAVVATRTGGLPEVVVDGETGLLVAGDAESAALAIGRLTRDSSLAADMGRRGRVRVEGQFSLDRMVAGTLEVYRRVVA